ncbi:type IV pilus assembly protein PilY1 [Azotobacter beijerinckii]|uniref:Type IV pilus assembly protein PilY1 n=2 Tax=Azotobacter beijerinckii TaxID=170623 RepID=A0A1H6QYU1_9GAMM|nr:type IV pilus assembly protein PilY1 [Azotobacter beijerinckii]
MHDYGVSVSYVDSAGVTQQQRVSVVTYTIDVFNKQQNAEQTGLMLSAATVGGGRYFAARNKNAIITAINSALSDILSVSSTFAAVTLPLSATNRAQQENQVFIGMFRPDQEAQPRWFGNLKRYQISLFNGQPELADANREQAINLASGFANECTASFWTEDSDDYWSELGITPPPRSQCRDESNTNSVWSDLPDGPFVEKGGVAQVTRNSNLDKRNIMTVGSTGLSQLTAIAGDSANKWLSYLYGKNVGLEEKAPESGGRPSIHGDVIHSRPLTINYGADTGVYVYYGANDGLFRAIKSESGEEQWSLLAPEHIAKIKRLYDDQPLVAFPNQELTATPTPQPKDYFFDGSIGQIVLYDETNEVDLAYIYPSMRRGGRMIYGLNVTDPTKPELLWRFGCPSLTTDQGCPTGYEGIGQTWSTPLGGYVSGYVLSDVKQPIVMFGGGYDTCLDNDKAAFPCSASAKGKGVYVLDAKDGTVLLGPDKLPTDAPVVAELASVDMDFDGSIDFAYAADAAGSLYRINFSTLNENGSLTPLGQDHWSITKIAKTNTQDSTRRFLNQPTVAVFQNSVYVALGSGNRERPLESNYPYVADVQDRFYVYVDRPGESQKAVDLDGSQLANVTEAAIGSGTSCEVTGQRGWYMDLKEQGEQVVNPAAIAGGQVLFNSYRPGGNAPRLCSRPLGIATAYKMSLFNPSPCDRERSTEIVGGGMPIPPIIATVPVTGESGTEEKVVTVCIGCEGLKVNEIKPNTDQTRRRVYWNSDIDR